MLSSPEPVGLKFGTWRNKPYLEHKEKKNAVMLSKFNRTKHQQYLSQLPKLSQSIGDTDIYYCPKIFRDTLIECITQAKHRIYLVALYLEHDEGGAAILNALYQVKQQRPDLEVSILVDWHRAQRGRIGAKAQDTNADWYCRMAQQHPGLEIPIYGVPVNTREALGVLHLKGFIIDSTVIYSGASLNNVYLYQQDKYRYDRYHLLRNPALADTMVNYIKQHLLTSGAVQRLDRADRPKNPSIKNEIRQLRRRLRVANYQYYSQATNEQLSIAPLVGLGKKSPLNKTIFHLVASTEKNLIICTPYFNLPTLLVKNIIRLLRSGVSVEIIVGDKTANDFYIPQEEPFRVIGAVPYLYEINLRQFIKSLQRFIDNHRLTVRVWKDHDNSFHLKGIWIDERWLLITGNNLNPRAWNLDLENAVLIHDPRQELAEQRQHELTSIRTHTVTIGSYKALEDIPQYPEQVRKIIRRLRRVRIDRLIRRIM